MKKIYQNDSTKGMTLIEILIALTIIGLAIAPLCSIFNSQQKTYMINEQATEMQQNLRATMYYLEREMRIIGYDPTGNANSTIILGGSSTLHFTADINDDGDTDDTNEDVEYKVESNVLLRNSQPVAENIELINFVYLDQNNNPLVTPLSTTDITAVRSVQITALIRNDRRDNNFINSVEYYNKQGDTILAPQGDHFKRRLLSTTVKCRNLGI